MAASSIYLFKNSWSDLSTSLAVPLCCCWLGSAVHLQESPEPKVRWSSREPQTPSGKQWPRTPNGHKSKRTQGQKGDWNSDWGEHTAVAAGVKQLAGGGGALGRTWNSRCEAAGQGDRTACETAGWDQRYHFRVGSEGTVGVGHTSAAAHPSWN